MKNFHSASQYCLSLFNFDERIKVQTIDALSLCPFGRLLNLHYGDDFLAGWLSVSSTEFVHIQSI